jgi:hypothetical protein
MNDIQNGDTVRDTITGFTGVAVAITTWLNGCTRITVQSKSLHEGKPIEPQTFDTEQMEVIAAPRIASSANARDDKPGGPRPEPTRQRDPR